ncbi:hypothetical protein C8R43DRAFT_965974 [Mycena crocata]|nr:hypothetical protein C8R43DRAFT_965974 [Mycena crocata]
MLRTQRTHNQASLLYDDGQGYDIGCQYYKNLHDAEAAEHTGDRDSDEMPALEPVPASDSDDEASPLPTPAATDAMGAPAVPGCDVCANAGTSESTGEGAPASAFSKYPCFSLPPMSPKAQVRAAAEEAELTLEEARRRGMDEHNIGITNGEGVERRGQTLTHWRRTHPRWGRASDRARCPTRTLGYTQYGLSAWSTVFAIAGFLLFGIVTLKKEMGVVLLIGTCQSKPWTTQDFVHARRPSPRVSQPASTSSNPTPTRRHGRTSTDSTPSRHRGSSTHSTPTHRRPNASQSHADSAFEYETRPGDTTYDTGFYVSEDGRRLKKTVDNVKKRRIAPSDLADDTFATWNPLPEGDDEPGQEGVTGDKRKRAEDAVGLLDSSSRTLADVYIRREWGTRYGTMAAPAVKRSGNGSLANSVAKIAEWKNGYWQDSSLRALNFVYQLGHGGHQCRRPAPTIRTMVVMDEAYIHIVDYRFCGCDAGDEGGPLEQLLRNGWFPATLVDPATCATFAALDLFRLLCVVGNINVHDFVGMLERATNAADMQSVPDRYKAFGVMSREWNWLMRMKRGGCAHNPAGMYATEQGELGVLCWACPHDDKNLPKGWREVSAEYRFLYMLLLAMDANFRLKSRLRPNERDDQPLGGWGHLVNEGPYKEHLVDYVAEKDVSTCIAFAALLQKDTRQTTGLRCSGVGGGGVRTTRGAWKLDMQIDLTYRDRYANMDYILLSSIIGITAMYLAISYDIACQWKINLETRMTKMPDELKLDLKKVTVLYGLPVWHAAAHERKCQVQNSLSYLVGVGRTDGEGIERTWSGLNPLAWSTKEMGRGARHDALEDKIDHHNFEKNINQAYSGHRRTRRQATAFSDVDDALEEATRTKWQKRIDDWVEDPNKANPYEVEDGEEAQDDSPGHAHQAVRPRRRCGLALTQDEAKDAAAGGRKLNKSSVTSFLVAGLQLEESQRRIREEIKGRPLLVADQTERVAEMRIAFFAKLRSFRKLQEIYMPGAVQEIDNDEERGQPTCPHPMRRISSSTFHRRCLRSVWGAGGGIGGEVQAARAALIALWGEEKCAAYKELQTRDIQLDEEREVDTRARKRLGGIGGTGRARRQGPAISSKERYLSWIWTAGGGPGENEGQIHDFFYLLAVRVEWSKAKARRDRWEEEVLLLREEMKHVLRFLRWRAMWWETKRGVRREQTTQQLRDGLDAYAARQAALHRTIARRYKTAWDTSAAVVVQVALQEEAWLAASRAAATEPLEVDDWSWVGEREDYAGQEGGERASSGEEGEASESR